jgi:hypothetical protein
MNKHKFTLVVVALMVMLLVAPSAQAQSIPTGSLALDASAPYMPGENLGIILTLSNPSPAQFIVDPMTADCAIRNLPKGFTSQAGQTSRKDEWFIYLPDSDGLCTISGTFHLLGDTTVYSFQMTFMVGTYKIYLPLVISSK